MGGKGSGNKPRHYYEIDGVRRALVEWIKFYCAPYDRTYNRLYRGWDILDALTAPTKAPGMMLTVGKVTRSIRAWSKHTGIPVRTLKRRRLEGWPPEEIIAPRKNVRLITAWNQTQHIAAWSREKKIPPTTLRWRLDVLKMSPEDALTMPSGRKQNKNEQ